MILEIVLLIFATVLTFSFFSKKSSKFRGLNLPPEPPGNYPIIGHLHMFKDDPIAVRNFHT
jgi:hypothetical protein